MALQQGTGSPAISTDSSILLGFKAQDPNTQIVGPSLGDVPYGMAISKAHPDFVRFVNGVLAKIEHNGTWQRLYANWLGDFTPVRPQPLPSRSTTVEMSRDDPARELTRLHEASDRIAANLVELEIDSSRQLLEVSTLTGRSADRWSQASAALTDLWRWQGQLKQLLERAEKLRGPWRANELRSLLDGESIELTRSEVPLAERDLLGSSEITVRCTAGSCSSACPRRSTRSRRSWRGSDDAWDALTPRVTAAQTAVDEAQALAAGLGEHHRRDLDEAARAVARLATSASADPLSTAPGDLDRLIDSLREIRRDLDATAALRREFDARVADARSLLASLETTTGEGRAAHEEALVKISVPTAAGAVRAAGRARRGARRDRFASPAPGHGETPGTSSTRGRRAPRRCSTSARQAVRANRAPIEARNQFRALLEAYQVKAQRLGVVEDPELEQIFARAHEALYTAPTDLALVAQLVRRYQELHQLRRLRSGDAQMNCAREGCTGTIVDGYCDVCGMAPARPRRPRRQRPPRPRRHPSAAPPSPSSRRGRAR